MKEAFWGVLIVLLGLFGIVVVNIFQNVTVDNDRVYYLIKETTEASAYDALDLTYYRLSGKLRIAEDKFVENLTRRFAENVTIGDYRIVVEDINEMPPKVSLRVRSGVSTLRGEKFGIVNRVDGILETKYKLDEVLDFLGITKEEWDRAEGSTIEKDDDTGENICKVIANNKDEIECITGDIKFAGFEDADVVESVCQDETPSGAKERKAKYKVCDCGKWVEESETLTANPTKVGNEWVYTWTFNKAGEIRTISETLKSRVRIDVCTTSIGEMVPKDIGEAKPKEDGSAYEPSKDNSSYMTCPAGGIKIPIGMKFVMHPNYIPKESVNRNLEWSTTDSEVVGVVGSNPASTCILDNEGTNCFSRATITAKKVGTAYVNVKTTRNQTASCKVEVFDGKVESIGCKDINDLYMNKTEPIILIENPKNAYIKNYVYSSSNTKVATIEGNSVTSHAGGTAIITVKDTITGKTGTCKVTVPSAKEVHNYPVVSDNDSGDQVKKAKYLVEGTDGKIRSFTDRKKAVEYAKSVAIEKGDSKVILQDKDNRHYEVNDVQVQYTGGNNHNIVNNDKLNDKQTVESTNIGGKKPSSNSNSGGSNSGGGGGSNTSVKKTNPSVGTSTKKDTPVTTTPKSSSSGKPSSSSSGKSTSSSGSSNKGSSSSGSSNKGSSSGSKVCLAEGTKVKLADGSTKNIEYITYNDLLLVWDYEKGTYTYEYPIWIEQEKYSDSYINVKFSDGSYLNIVGEHALYDVDKNEFANINDLTVGSTVAKINNGKLTSAKIISMEEVNKAIKYYHVVSTRYYNIIANDILTTDDNVILSNLYGFNDNITWKYRDYENIDLYEYNEFKDIMPYYMFKGLRAEEAKVLNKYISKNEFRTYFLENQLNPNMVLLPKTNLFGQRLWMVTTSDDSLNMINNNKYLMVEGSNYIVPEPLNKANFTNWYNTSDGKYYNPGDMLRIDMGTHLVAMYK